MRGIPLVLTVAFVFASSALLVHPASAQSEPDKASEPYPGDYQQQPTDAVLQGRVLDAAGNPVAGAMVSAYNSGPVYYTEAQETTTSSDGGASGSTTTSPVYYGGNQTTTAADGSFRMGVYSGDNQLSAYRDGYAQAYVQVSVQPGQTVTQDLTLEKFPDKTARIEGRVTDQRTGKGLPFASVSVSSPVYGTYECSMREGEESGGGETKPMPADDSASIVAPDYSFPGCSITIDPDGVYSGLVTPGYSILSVYAYSDCYASMDADGSSSNSCGPQYFAFSRTLDLPANQTTTVNVPLRSHAPPDATVSGYLVDAETGKAIPGGQISFNNQESYGYGFARTDEDGSYSLRLRSGYHSVSVWAPGHLPWEGVLMVPDGSSDLDVEMTPGEPAYGGGCCYPYRGGVGVAGAESAPAPGAPAGMAVSDGSATGDGDDQTAQEEVLYEDLGGGLGPYDAAERQGAGANDDDLEDGKGSPGAGLLAILGALALALVAFRRRAA